MWCKVETGVTDLKCRIENPAAEFHDDQEETPMTPHRVGQGVANEKQLRAQEAALTCSENPSVDPRRLLGAYYTPDPLPGILTEWALTPGRGTVLDPSLWWVRVPECSNQGSDRQGRSGTRTSGLRCRRGPVVLGVCTQ